VLGIYFVACNLKPNFVKAIKSTNLASGQEMTKYQNQALQNKVILFFLQLFGLGHSKFILYFLFIVIFYSYTDKFVNFLEVSRNVWPRLYIFNIYVIKMTNILVMLTIRWT